GRHQRPCPGGGAPAPGSGRPWSVRGAGAGMSAPTPDEAGADSGFPSGPQGSVSRNFAAGLSEAATTAAGAGVAQSAAYFAAYCGLPTRVTICFTDDSSRLRNGA